MSNFACTSVLHDIKCKTLSIHLSSAHSDCCMSKLSVRSGRLSSLGCVSASLWADYLVGILRKYSWIIVDIQHSDEEHSLCVVHWIRNLDKQLVFRSFFKIQRFHQHHHSSVPIHSKLGSSVTLLRETEDESWIQIHIMNWYPSHNYTRQRIWNNHDQCQSLLKFILCNTFL